MRYTFILWILVLVPALLTAQRSTDPCGTRGEWAELVTQRLKANQLLQETQGVVRFRETIYLPIKFHLVAQNDGGGRVAERKVLDQLCALNQDFADMDIQFFIKDGFNYLDNSAVFDNHVPAINTIMTLEQDPGAINIWIVDDAAPSSDNEIGITLGYYDPRKDWIVVNRDYISDNNIILTHEMGHFFSLLHTHNGWDSEPYRDEEKPAPANAEDGTPTEKVDGSNCREAGDFLCDTRPDYNGLGIGCDFSLKVFDPDSVLIDPDETNFMSYFLECRREDYIFSEGQKNLVITDANSSGRDKLRNPEPDSKSMISGTPTLTYPVNDEEATGNGTVTLQWEPAEGATTYLVQVDRIGSFSSVELQNFIATENSLEVSGLEVDKRYHWRVRPFNDYFTCTDFSSSESFYADEKTATVNTITELQSWSVSPNPVRGRTHITLSLESDRSFDADINLFGLDGRQLQALGRQAIPAGSTRIDIPVQNLASGIYLLSLTTRSGRLNQRIVVFE